VYTFGAVRGLVDLPIVAAHKVCGGNESSVFECAPFDENIESCSHQLDLGAICYHSEDETQLQVSLTKCSPSTHHVSDPNQPLIFGCIDFYSTHCRFNASGATSFVDSLDEFAACSELIQPPGYCHGALRTAAQLRNEEICQCGASVDIGFHIRIPFFVHTAGQYAFRVHAKFGRGSFMGVDGMQANPGIDGTHIRFGPHHFDKGDHEVEVLGFEDCCDSHVEIEVHLPCDGPLDEDAIWRIVRSGADACMACGRHPELSCLSDETALSTELLTPRARVSAADTRHAICGGDGQWHGAFPRCVECGSADLVAGRCGTVCAFGIDDDPPIANAGWGGCEPGGTLIVGQQCEFQCDEGYVSYRSSQQTGRPRAECRGYGRSVQLSFVGQCVDPACVDNGDWATDFPAVTGTITTPLSCSPSLSETELATCRLEHAKGLSRRAQELAAQRHEMFDQPPLPHVDHVLLYPVEATAQLHTMFDDGRLEIVDMVPSAGGVGRRLQHVGNTGSGVRRALALSARIVVHAATLPVAQDLHCRFYAQETNASCCLLPSACPGGAPVRCDPLCQLALDSESIAQCDAPWFEAWHQPLASLCEDATPVDVDICRDTKAGAAGTDCGAVLSFGMADEARSPQLLCQRILRAPAGQRVQLIFSALDLAPGDFVTAFDGATQDAVLVQLEGQDLPNEHAISSSHENEMLVTMERSSDKGVPSRFVAQIKCIEGRRRQLEVNKVSIHQHTAAGQPTQPASYATRSTELEPDRSDPEPYDASMVLKAGTTILSDTGLLQLSPPAPTTTNIAKPLTMSQHDSAEPTRIVQTPSSQASDVDREYETLKQKHLAAKAQPRRQLQDGNVDLLVAAALAPGQVCAVDPCSFEPCFNGGTCTAAGLIDDGAAGAFRCQCAVGYIGVSCTSPTSVVPSTPTPAPTASDMQAWLESGELGSFQLNLDDDVASVPQSTAVQTGQTLAVSCVRAAASALCEWPGAFLVSVSGGQFRTNDGSGLRLSQLSFTGVVGQAVHLDGGVNVIESCSFTRCGGPSVTQGGAIGIFHGDSTITDCTFVGNSATDYAGAVMWYPEVTDMRLSGCTFRGNTANIGDAVDIWGGWMSSNPPPTLRWRGPGYSNEEATSSDLQPYSFTGCVATCTGGMIRQSDGCHRCGGGGNSCRYANDGECDEPAYCDQGTDSVDCGGGSNGSCPPHTHPSSDGDGCTCDGGYSVNAAGTACEPSSGGCPPHAHREGDGCACDGGYSVNAAQTGCEAAGGTEDSCAYAKDGECDEPQYCSAGTDATDCIGHGHRR
jgi:hypothetical protein